MTALMARLGSGTGRILLAAAGALIALATLLSRARQAGRDSERARAAEAVTKRAQQAKEVRHAVDRRADGDAARELQRNWSRDE